MFRRLLSLWAFAVLCSACARSSSPRDAGVTEPPALAQEARFNISGTRPRRLVARVVREYPHATDAFTQGLVFHQGSLFESTGRQGSLRRLSLEQARPTWMQQIPGTFPEGLASDGERLLQLTWHDEQLLTWKGSPPTRQQTLRYQGEGWGLCYRKGRFVRSDGSTTLHLHEPVSFREVGTLKVTLGGTPPLRAPLNELECTEDTIYANLWHSSDIYQIDPDSGAVVAVIDASELSRRVGPALRDPEAVLNGIAIEPGTGRIFLTGKYWPTLFEVRFEPAP